MAKKMEELCKWKQSKFEKELETLRKIVAHPRFVCTKCGRVADSKKWLCEPVKL